MKTGLVFLGAAQTLFAQAKEGGAYFAGQVVGVIFLVVLVGAILWKFLGKKSAKKRSQAD